MHGIMRVMLYDAIVIEVLSATELDVLFDLGFNTYRRESVSLRGILIPEYRERQAFDFTSAWLKRHASKRRHVRIAVNDRGAIVMPHYADSPTLNIDLVAEQCAVTVHGVRESEPGPED